jgi:hypothetical protein
MPRTCAAILGPRNIGLSPTHSPAAGRCRSWRLSGSAGQPVVSMHGRQLSPFGGCRRPRTRPGTQSYSAAEDAGTQPPSCIVEGLSPRSGDYVLEKSKPSAFFGTDLLVVARAQPDRHAGDGRSRKRLRLRHRRRCLFVQLPGRRSAGCGLRRSELVGAVNLFDPHVKYANLLSPAGCAVLPAVSLPAAPSMTTRTSGR